MKSTMRCFIRRDLIHPSLNKGRKHSYRAAQSIHISCAYILEHGFPSNWENNRLLIYGLKNQNSLLKWIEILKKFNIKYSEFREPDLNNQLTGFSCIHDDDDFFKKLSLL